jgi:orotate phosphoribosyltransferase
MKVVLVEDVVHTGQRALTGVRALRTRGADVVDAVCLLDRQVGGAQRLSEAGVNLRPLFTEKQLLQMAHEVGT